MTTSATNGQVATPLPLPPRALQEQWAALPVSQRLRAVREFRHALVDEVVPLCRAVAEDIGKRPAETLAFELLPLAEACRFLERHAARLLRPRRVSLWDRPLWLWGQQDWVHRRSRGCVGIIGTWNYPLYLNGTQILQAATAGNAILWKPSEVAPATADALWRVLQQAGFPDGLLQRLPATREAGRQLSDAAVDHVVFTGHADTGRNLAAHLGRRLVSSTLELSGCDALFVLADANLALAARAAWFGATVNRGQTCLAVRRVFVVQSRYEAFLAELQRLSADVEPMHLAVPAQAQQVHALVQEALAAGARLLTPLQEAPSGSTIKPTLLADVRPDMAVCREASFAPLLAVIPVADVEAAIAAQDLCPYALGASVFTNSPAQAEHLGRRLRVGSFTINDVIAPTAHPATPFGGTGASGWGVTQGAEGLLEMTFPQVVSRRSGTWRPHYDPPESTPLSRLEVLKATLVWGHARRWWDRWRALRDLLRGLR